MEEDIVYLEEVIDLAKTPNVHLVIKEKEIEALENLIKGYRELEREKEMHKNNSNKLYKDYNNLTDEFDLLNTENNRNKETIKRYRKYLNKKDKRFKEALENEYQERETDYIRKSKIKEKIEELEEEIDKLADEASKSILENNQGKFDLVNKSANNISMQIQVLQELMEDK